MARKPFVYFERLEGETHDEFMEKNKLLEKSKCQSMNADGRKFERVFDLSTISKEVQDNPDMMIYFDYMVAVINLYAALCADRNREAIAIIKTTIGIDDYFMLTCSETDERAIGAMKFNQSLKTALVNLSQAIFFNWEPFNVWSDSVKVRCYFWELEF